MPLSLKLLVQFGPVIPHSECSARESFKFNLATSNIAAHWGIIPSIRPILKKKKAKKVTYGRESVYGGSVGESTNIQLHNLLFVHLKHFYQRVFNFQTDPDQTWI